MQCAQCGFDNPTTESYCRACGKKIKYSRSKVEDSLLVKAETRDSAALEEQCRSYLVIAIAVFLLAMTIKVMYGRSGWPRPVEVPASGLTAQYLDCRYFYEEQPVRAVFPVPTE